MTDASISQALKANKSILDPMKDLEVDLTILAGAHYEGWKVKQG